MAGRTKSSKVTTVLTGLPGSPIPRDDPNPLQDDGDADGIGDDCDPCRDDPLDDIDLDGFCGDQDTGRRGYCNPDAYNGLADTFYVNRGDGRFVDRTAEAGLLGPVEALHTVSNVEASTGALHKASSNAAAPLPPRTACRNGTGLTRTASPVESQPSVVSEYITCLYLGKRGEIGP